MNTLKQYIFTSIDFFENVRQWTVKLPLKKKKKIHTEIVTQMTLN